MTSNLNCKIGKEGFFFKYIYSYKNYLNNFYIGNEELLKNKCFTIFINIINKEKIKYSYTLGLLNINDFENYETFILNIKNNIKNIIEKNNIEINFVKEIELCIWELDFIWNEKVEKNKIKVIEKKWKMFNYYLDLIINLRISNNFNTFKLTMLLKTFKNYLYLIIPNDNDIVEFDIETDKYINKNHEKCIKHLYNLIKVLNLKNFVVLRTIIIKTIEKYNKKK